MDSEDVSPQMDALMHQSIKAFGPVISKRNPNLGISRTFFWRPLNPSTLCLKFLSLPKKHKDIASYIKQLHSTFGSSNPSFCSRSVALNSLGCLCFYGKNMPLSISHQLAKHEAYPCLDECDVQDCTVSTHMWVHRHLDKQTVIQLIENK